MTQQRKERPPSLIRALILSRLRAADQEAAERIADMIERFALFLMYADSDTKYAVMDLLFSVLPEDIVVSLISDYAGRISERYRRIKDVVARLAPRVVSGSEVDVVTAVLREAFEAYMRQRGAQAQQQEQQKKEVVIRQLPEELRKLLLE
jgi:hypothetical protein